MKCGVQQLFPGVKGGKWTDWKDVNRGSETIFTFPFPMKTVLFEIETDTVPTENKMADLWFAHAGGYTNPSLNIRIKSDKVNTLWSCIDEPIKAYPGGPDGTWRIKKTPTRVSAWFDGEFYSEYTFKDKVSELSAKIS